MRWQHSVRAVWSLAIAISVLSLPAWAQQEKTSENTPFLKTFLQRRPQADVNKDGILTLEEAQQDRRKNPARPRDATQRVPGRQVQRPAPTHADVAYGEHERNVLDFWQAAVDRPAPLFVWIHGGGFRAGDKSSIPVSLLEPCLKAGISCASINYRLTDTAPYPAQMHDSARAIQFLRSKATQWNIDPKRLAAGGGSAGSGISQWLGFHDCMASRDSSDPVARQSTRLACVLPISMQSTYDPREIKKLVPGDTYKHPALVTFFGRPQDWDWDSDPVDDALDALLKDASPINHLTADDPPAFILQFERANTVGNIHHANFAKHLKQSMDKLGIECDFHMDTDFDSIQAAHAEMVKFLQKQFGAER